MKKILLTGGTGQLGSALQDENENATIVAPAHADLDIADPDVVKKVLVEIKPNIVINAAAYTDVDKAESDFDGAYRGNKDGPQNLAQMTREMHIPLLHISTDYVFDGKSNKPYTEDDKPNPKTVYGASKLAGEEEVRKGNPKHFIVRSSWLYHTSGKNFPKTILSLADQGEVRVVDDQIGSPTYAPHLAKALLKLIQTRKYGTYHLAGSGSTSWYGLTLYLFKKFDINAKITPVTTEQLPRPAPRPAYSVLTTKRGPEFKLPSWEKGVDDFYKGMQTIVKKG